MAQTRLEKIGTIYSRLLGLYKSGAAKQENRPLWFDVYEAFPPKYEPRWDRHQLNYGNGGNVTALGPPRKLLYNEDTIRAQFYKVFGGEHEELLRGEVSDDKKKIEQTFNLCDNSTETLAQKFINKYKELDQKSSQDISIENEQNLFRATVEALELEGVNLLNPAASQNVEVLPKAEEIALQEPPKIKRPSLREIFQKESEQKTIQDEKS